MPALPSFAEVRARATIFGGRNRGSSLKVWMRKNYRYLERGLVHGGFGWDDLMRMIEASPELKNARGEVPSLKCAQATFYSVRDEKLAARKR